MVLPLGNLHAPPQLSLAEYADRFTRLWVYNTGSLLHTS